MKIKPWVIQTLAFLGILAVLFFWPKPRTRVVEEPFWFKSGLHYYRLLRPEKTWGNGITSPALYERMHDSNNVYIQLIDGSGYHPMPK